jgi:hypothetical protein
MFGYVLGSSTLNFGLGAAAPGRPSLVLSAMYKRPVRRRAFLDVRSLLRAEPAEREQAISEFVAFLKGNEAEPVPEFVRDTRGDRENRSPWRRDLPYGPTRSAPWDDRPALKRVE